MVVGVVVVVAEEAMVIGERLCCSGVSEKLLFVALL